MSLNVPILSLRLLDIPMPDKPDVKKGLLNSAKDLLRAQEPALRQQAPDIQLFHNQQIRYSGIQVGCFQGAPEWTAIGTESVEALQFWFDLYKKESPVPLQNTVGIREQYQPAFLDHPKPYHIDRLLISDGLAKSLNTKKNSARRQELLEKYLYGNLQNFFSFIGFEHDKKAHYLKISITQIKRYQEALPVFHRQKKTAFALHFECNFRLPQTLRIGQSTALGYGTLRHL